MDSSPRCSKCGGAMELGFLLDPGHGIVVHQLAWIEGTPAVGYSGVRTVGRRTLRCVTLRCEACGFFESYAERQKKAGPET